MGKQKFIFHWAGVDGPCAKFFDSLESLLAFYTGWTSGGDGVLMVTPWPTRQSIWHCVVVDAGPV